MTKARVNLISLPDTPWYHLINRCVRRAFLCGHDSFSGQSYEHRREWIEVRIRQLANVFAIDVAAYSVMSNHYHLVVRVNRELALSWSRDEVLAQWLKIFSGPELVTRYLAGDDLSEGQLLKLDEIVDEYRQRLFDISWFMRVLNESVARMANKEDGVKGRFWEGRFKSQALLDEAAILSVMAYVDLNPIRACMAEVPEDSDYTSLASRLHGCEGAYQAPQSMQVDEIKDQTRLPDYLHKINKLPVAALMPFDGAGNAHDAIPFSFVDYCELVECFGRAILPNKRGHIDQVQPKLCQRLGIDMQLLIDQAKTMLDSFGHAVGSVASLQVYSERHGKCFSKGSGLAKKLYKAA